MFLDSLKVAVETYLMKYSLFRGSSYTCVGLQMFISTCIGLRMFVS
jgi:hypothetical protein